MWLLFNHVILTFWEENYLYFYLYIYHRAQFNLAFILKYSLEVFGSFGYSS